MPNADFPRALRGKAMRKVHSFMPTTDDWFVVSNIEDKRWSIERVSRVARQFAARLGS